MKVKIWRGAKTSIEPTQVWEVSFKDREIDNVKKVVLHLNDGSVATIKQCTEVWEFFG